MTAMRLGVDLPVAGEGTSRETILQVAGSAERIGLDSVWSWELRWMPRQQVFLSASSFWARRTLPVPAPKESSSMRIEGGSAPEPQLRTASPVHVREVSGSHVVTRIALGAATASRLIRVRVEAEFRDR